MQDDRIAPHVAERIVRAEDMLGRLGHRDVYEPNYATEKLYDAARQALEACALLGMDKKELLLCAGDAFLTGSAIRERLDAEDG